MLLHIKILVGCGKMKNLFKIYLVTLFVLVITSCGGGGGGAAGAPTTTADTESPQFKGFVLAVSGNTEEVTVAWMPASDTGTVSSEIEYKLYFGTDANFIPDASNLYQTYIGETSAVVTGLTAGITYYFKIIASDEAGNQTEAQTATSATTATTSSVRSTTLVKEATELNLGIAQIDSTDDSILVFQKNSNSVLPEVGSVLIGEDSTGNGYLRIVLSASEDATTITVVTSAGALSDVFESAELSSEFTLRAPDSGSNSLRTLKAGGVVSTSQSHWKNKLLTITESGKNPITTENNKALTGIFDASKTAISVSANEALTLTGEITFEPTVKTDVSFGFFMISSATATVSGSLSAELTLKYDYTGATTVNDSKEVFNRTFVSKYAIGGVPVWQETTLKLTAQFKGNATTAVSAETNATATSSVSITAGYDGSQWTATSTDSFDSNLTVSASAHGKATAEVRLVPEVKVRFYKVATATMSVEPYTRAVVEGIAEAEANTNENTSSAAYGFTKFDAFLGVDVYAVADLTVFSYNAARYPETGRANLFNIETQLFGLPTIAAKLTGIPNINANPLQLTASSTPFNNSFGLINAFDTSSAEWNIFPSVEIANGMSTTWAPPSHGSIYKAIFVGNSTLLGAFGRQFVEASFTLPSSTVPTDLDMRDGDTDGMPNIWESHYELNLSANDSNDDPDVDEVNNLNEYLAGTNPKDYLNVAPTALFTLLPATGDTDTVFQVDASTSSDAEDTLNQLQFRWNWNGGVEPVWEGIAFSSSATASHTYTTAGTYTVWLQVMDSGGLLDIQQLDVTVNSLEPIPPELPEEPPTTNVKYYYTSSMLYYPANLDITGNRIEGYIQFKNQLPISQTNLSFYNLDIVDFNITDGIWTYTPEAVNAISAISGSVSTDANGDIIRWDLTLNDGWVYSNDTLTGDRRYSLNISGFDTGYDTAKSFSAVWEAINPAPGTGPVSWTAIGTVTVRLGDNNGWWTRQVP